MTCSGHAEWEEGVRYRVAQGRIRWWISTATQSGLGGSHGGWVLSMLYGKEMFRVGVAAVEGCRMQDARRKMQVSQESLNKQIT